MSVSSSARKEEKLVPAIRHIVTLGMVTLLLTKKKECRVIRRKTRNALLQFLVCGVGMVSAENVAIAESGLR